MQWCFISAQHPYLSQPKRTASFALPVVNWQDHPVGLQLPWRDLRAKQPLQQLLSDASRQSKSSKVWKCWTVFGRTLVGWLHRLWLCRTELHDMRVQYANKTNAMLYSGAIKQATIMLTNSTPCSHLDGWWSFDEPCFKPVSCRTVSCLSHYFRFSWHLDHQAKSTHNPLHNFCGRKDVKDTVLWVVVMSYI